MMKITLICVGSLKEKYLRDAVAEYAKRMSGMCAFSIEEIGEKRLPDSPSEREIEQALEAESVEILKRVPPQAKLIAMCIEGKMLGSAELAKTIGGLSVGGASSLCFVIGGSFGLSDKVKSAADMRLSMSPMTFPHQLARVMLCEQIYRAFMINRGSKYHK
ncbi:MAG: 23S rRNA (pseudouridine(1915)-N(3))-methyltransferase RlmH [Acutalibacteraceae bacterium]